MLVLTVVVTVGLLTPGRDGGPGSLVGVLVVVLIGWWVVRNGGMRRRSPEARQLSGGSPTAPPVTDPGTHPATQPVPQPVTRAVAGQPTSGRTTPGRTDDFEVPTSPQHPQDSIPLRPIADPWTATPPARPSSAMPPHPAPVHGMAPAVRRARPSWLLTLFVGGLAILAYVGVDALPVPGHRPWAVALAASLGVLGLTLVVTAFTPYRAPLVAAATWIIGLSLLTSGGTTSTPVPDQFWRPTTADQVRSRYELGSANATIDLSAVPVDGTRTIDIRHGVGDLTLRLPQDRSHSLTVDHGVGDIRLREGGTTREISAGPRDDADGPITVGHGPQAYSIDLEHGVGDVTVELVPGAAGSSPQESR